VHVKRIIEYLCQEGYHQGSSNGMMISGFKQLIPWLMAPKSILLLIRIVKFNRR
jgi:hypothetical protein